MDQDQVWDRAEGGRLVVIGRDLSGEMQIPVVALLDDAVLHLERRDAQPARGNHDRAAPQVVGVGEVHRAWAKSLEHR